jgi:O-antigen ligase
VFGVLAFAALLALFYWLFARILQNLQHLDTYDEADKEQLRCMVVGVGAALLAAMAQGQIDSAFLEQDLAFFFWTLLAALLILRVLSHTPWRKTAETTI